MKRFRQRKAFTIVEMVIVIAVIAILATVLVPTISGVIQKANHSADTQFVASLNVQLALWQVDNGDITNESDLREAINYYYGDEGAEDFYATLAPKSAAQGYHYWWNATDKTMVLAKYEDLLPKQDEGQPALIDNENVLTFSPASPRSLEINGKNYFLMDQAGSELAKYLKEVDTIGAKGDHESIKGTLAALEDDATLADLVAAKLGFTAVANNFGVFFDNGTASYVYIPYGITEIGASEASGNLEGVKEIYLPDGVKVFSKSLVGFATDAAGDWNRPNATTIFVNAEESDLKNIFSAESTDCVIQLPNGDRYIVERTAIKKLTETGPADAGTSDYSTNVTEFKLSGSTGSAERAFHFDVAGSTIYYTSDFSGDDYITLTVSDIVDDSGSSDTVYRDIVWSQNGVAIQSEYGEGSSLTVKASDIGSGKISVTVQAIVYEVSFQEVKVDKIAFDTFDGATIPANQIGKDENGITQLTQTLNYSVSKNTWSLPLKVTYNVTLPTDCAMVAPSYEITAVKSDDENMADTYLVYSDKKLNFTDAGKALTADIEHNITIVCADAKLKCKLTLSNANQIVFNVSNDTYALNKYQSPFVFTFGTTGEKTSVTLAELFKYNPDLTTALDPTEKVTLSISGQNDKELTGSNWSNEEILLSSLGGNNLKITLSCRGKKNDEVTVNIVTGAYNVTSEIGWKNAGSNVVILNDIDLGTSFNNTSKTVSYLNGNMSRIDATEYTFNNASSHTNVFFIKMSSGTIENVAIDGPVYPEVLLSSNHTTGYYAPGIRVGGGTATSPVSIKNSYISGFFAPVRIDSGYVHIYKSTLDGGINCNLYIYDANSVVLEDSMTVQKGSGYLVTYSKTASHVGSKRVKGAGITVDTKASKVPTIYLKGDTKQYNWICGADKQYGETIETIISNLFNRTGSIFTGYTYTTVKDATIKHTIDNTEYLNAGIAQERQAYDKITIDTTGYNGGYTYKRGVMDTSPMKNPLYPTLGDEYAASGFYVSTLQACTDCNCQVNPDEQLTKDTNNDGKFDTVDGDYNYEDFLSARLNASFKN